jgi:hypothetical protein
MADERAKLFQRTQMKLIWNYLPVDVTRVVSAKLDRALASHGYNSSTCVIFLLCVSEHGHSFCFPDYSSVREGMSSPSTPRRVDLSSTFCFRSWPCYRCPTRSFERPCCIVYALTCTLYPLCFRDSDASIQSIIVQYHSTGRWD